jgi:uroporphyrinogen decarboxylase
MRQAGRSLPEYRAIRERASLVEITRDAALCAEVTLQPVRRLGVDAAILFADITTPLPGLGVDYRIEDGIGPVVARPIRTAVDVTSLRPFVAAKTVPGLLDAIRLVRDASPVPLIGFAGAPFTLACYLVEGRPSRDFLTVKAMLHEDPELFAALMSRLVTMTLDYLRAQVDAGVRAVQVFDSWVGGLSPLDYRVAVQPHMRRLFDGLAALGVPTIHFGTATAGLLSAMADAGGDVIGVDWRIDLADARRMVPGRAVQGNLDPALLLGPFGAVEAHARWILGQVGGEPGHVFNLGHGVLPATDPDHLRRLVALVHEVSSVPSPVLERSAP